MAMESSCPKESSRQFIRRRSERDDTNIGINQAKSSRFEDKDNK